MGCSNTKEKLENRMMELKIKKLEIQKKKYDEIQKLSEIVGHKIKYNHIPDYIDPKFAKEHKIFFDISNMDKKTELKETNIKRRNSKNTTKINS